MQSRFFSHECVRALFVKTGHFFYSEVDLTRVYTLRRPFFNLSRKFFNRFVVFAYCLFYFLFNISQWILLRMYTFFNAMFAPITNGEFTFEHPSNIQVFRCFESPKIHLVKYFKLALLPKLLEVARHNCSPIVRHSVSLL